MSGKKFTPADVVKRYQETGTTPVTGGLGVVRRDGKWCPVSGKCCALGVMMIDKPVPPGISDGPEFTASDDYIRAMFDIDYEMFYDGFDYQRVRTIRTNSGTGRQHPDNELGIACRKAVEEAGLMIKHELGTP